jgi:pimeloyl-ACP methyl ester carboxylesterase
MSAIFFQDEIVHYEVLGRGRPLMFLHGWVGSWRYWVPTMQATSALYRSYAMDMWGFGDTGKDQTRYGLENQVSLLEGFLDQMGILRIALVGHGLGAIISLRLAHKRPDMVDRVLAAGVPVRKDKIGGRIQSESPVSLLDWLLPKEPVTDAVRLDTPKTDPEAVHQSLKDLAAMPEESPWVLIEQPCVLVFGQQDPVVEHPQDEFIEELPEHVQVISFDDASHFPMLTNSVKFNRLLLDFLSLKSGESPSQLQLKDYWKRRVR